MSGFLFAGFLVTGFLVTGLLSLRLSADGLRVQAEKPNLESEDIKQFRWVTGLNWLAFVTLSAAFVMLAVFATSYNFNIASFCKMIQPESGSKITQHDAEWSAKSRCAPARPH